MFRFKQFIIQQDRCAMKVGTDGVLLGAWSDVENAAHILDVGTGTGLIALMLAQRNKNAEIDAIEIEKNACEQAAENVSNSPWANRITVFHQTLQDFFPAKKYDMIASNPPYFSQSLKNPNAEKQLARHTDSLTPEDFLRNAKRLLQFNGKLSLIFPANESYHFIKTAKTEGFFCTRLTKVFPKIGAKEKRFLMEFSLSPALCVETDETVTERSRSIVIENTHRHEYSEDYKNLTKDFYLNV